MPPAIVILGSGYAGAGAVNQLESELGETADITWVSEKDHHLVLHESHRCIRDPTVKDAITIPIEEIKSANTDFIQEQVEDVDTEDRNVTLSNGEIVEYDYLLVAIGSQTSFFGIEGLEENAYTIEGIDEVLEIHNALVDATENATETDPAEVFVGGAGLSGIQTAGEIAQFGEERESPVNVHLVEGMDTIFPNSDSEVQQALRTRLEELDVDILTGEFITSVDADTVTIGDNEFEYDVLIWTGGITGQDLLSDIEVEKHDRNDRLSADMNFQTEDERVFAIGDCALIEQAEDTPAPPTAEAAWDAAEHVGTNIARKIRGEPLRNWRFDSKGTAISIGEDAVAHDIEYIPIETFSGRPARTIKKAIAARWIASITDYERALKSWPDM